MMVCCRSVEIKNGVVVVVIAIAIATAVVVAAAVVRGQHSH